jgi:hypothetical protein
VCRQFVGMTSFRGTNTGAYYQILPHGTAASTLKFMRRANQQNETAI